MQTFVNLLKLAGGEKVCNVSKNVLKVNIKEKKRQKK